MRYTLWLRRQVERLEEEIRNSPTLDSDQPASADQLRSLREKVVLHTYLKQQLLRREAVKADDEFDTKELMLVPTEPQGFRGKP